MHFHSIPEELLPDLNNKLDSFKTAFKDTGIDIEEVIKKDQEFFSVL
ncbi:MAG: hypothetical protein Q8M56_18615 [Desulfobacterales bacterium]|nr:hypothetical protein [Desulfobacterales bacterium]